MQEICTSCGQLARLTSWGLCRVCQIPRRRMDKIRPCVQCGQLGVYKESLCQSCYDIQYNSRCIQCGSEKVKQKTLHLCKCCYERGKYQCSPDAQRRYHFKCQYGISLQDYDRLLKKQRGGCAICGRTPTSRWLAVDHDHKTNKIRGLLCTQCNLMLGVAQDSIETLHLAVKYLRKSYR